MNGSKDLVPLEASILMSLHHQSIIKVENVVQDARSWVMVMECPDHFIVDGDGGGVGDGFGVGTDLDINAVKAFSPPRNDLSRVFTQLKMEKSRDLFE